jgi:hypothetical protein
MRREASRPAPLRRNAVNHDTVLALFVIVAAYGGYCIGRIAAVL